MFAERVGRVALQKTYFGGPVACLPELNGFIRPGALS